MPHIIIEHDKDIKEEINLSELARALHETLSIQETVKLESIKTRSVEVNNIIIGSCETAQKILHVTVLLLSGRSPELKQLMAQSLFDKVKEKLGKLECSVTVNIDELATYIK